MMPSSGQEARWPGWQPKATTSEWYWYSKARCETNQRVDTTDDIDKKLQALHAYQYQSIQVLSLKRTTVRVSSAGL